MQTKIHEPTQIVEVMLTHAEQADEAVKKQLKELYAQYKGTKYTVAVFLSGKRDLGRQVMGYYDPAKPERITENRPRKPVLGGFLFFFGALILLFFGIMTFTGNITIS